MLEWVEIDAGIAFKSGKGHGGAIAVAITKVICPITINWFWNLIVNSDSKSVACNPLLKNRHLLNRESNIGRMDLAIKVDP